MTIDTNTIATMTEANQIDLEQAGSSPDRELTDDEKIDIVARQILKEYKPAFLELAK